MTFLTTTMRGLVWNDYRRHRAGIILGIGSVVLIQLVVGAIAGPSEVSFFYLLGSMAAACGLGFGRSEWVLGEEEFAMALPATREERYDARLLIGCAVLFVLYVAGALGSFTELPGALWSAFSLPTMDEGARARLLEREGTLAWVVLWVLPLLLFAETFARSMDSRGREDLRWVPEFSGVAAGCFGLFLLDRWLLGENAGWLAGVGWLVFAALRLRAGRRGYARRDAILDATQEDEGARMKLLFLTLVLGGLVALGFVAWYAAASRMG